jgi:hypothetical protein
MFGMSNQRETRGTFFFMVESAPENREGPEVNEVADIFLDRVRKEAGLFWI